MPTTPATSSLASAENSGLANIDWRVQANGSVLVVLRGAWSMAMGIPAAGELFDLISERPQGTAVALDASGLTAWDSTLPVFLLRLLAVCRAKKLSVDTAGLPTAVHALLLQAGQSGSIGAGAAEKPQGALAFIGALALHGVGELQAQLDFLGRVALACAALIRRPRRFRLAEFFFLLCQCGPGAVPIVTLVSLLTGMILAFVGAVQLRMFGAQLYIADLVGLGMAREMGAMMTAVLVAGRTGAAYAAELGSMRVNEEIDALDTLGINAIEFLVVPRILALTLVTPLLCIYADAMGVLGGALVSAGLFGISMPEYFNESRMWLDMTDFGIGIVKSGVFAVLVAVAGCMRGMRCGSNSTEVGYAATNAVVTAIVWVVVADAILTLIIATLDI